MEAAGPGWRGWMPAALSWDRAGLQRILACTEVKGSVGTVRAACIVRVAVYILVFPRLFPCFFLSDFVRCMVVSPSLPHLDGLSSVHIWLFLPLFYPVWLFPFVCVGICVCLSPSASPSVPSPVLSLSVSPSLSVRFLFQQLFTGPHCVPVAPLGVEIQW